ncbi:lantibiotic dehydratase [Myceligenerans cantabricum]
MGSWVPDMHSGVLRASAHLINRADLAEWPGNDAGYGSWRDWIAVAWKQSEINTAVRLASPSLADRIEGLLAGQACSRRAARRAATSLAGYLLRAHGRATPFGLFAGTTTVMFAADAAWSWNPVHPARLRPDARWLSHIVHRLEADPGVLHRTRVQASNLLIVRAGDIVVSWQPHLSAPPVDGQEADIHFQRLDIVERILHLAAAPIQVEDLTTQVAASQTGCTPETVGRLVAQLVEVGALITALRPPGTVTDPLAHIMDHLTRAGAAQTRTGRDLDRVQAHLSGPLTGTLEDAARAAAAAEVTMRELAPTAQITPVGVDVQIGAQAVLPAAVAAEAAAAAEALASVAPPAHAGWDAWRAQFLDRYGPATPIPVTRAIDPVTGLGLPDHFTAPSTSVVSQRDETLLALAGQALLDRQPTIELDTATRDTFRARAGGEVSDGLSADLWADVRSRSLQALQAGQFQLGVTGFGRRTAAAGRFADLLDIQPHTTPTQDTEGNDESGPLIAQLSFPSRDLRTENVLRVPRLYDHVIALGEHRPPDRHVLELEDLAVMADTSGQLHLVSLRHQRRVEAHIPHAGARHTMPPLARFVFEISRLVGPAITGFDWGAATALTHLPRVTSGRSILTPARWRLRLQGGLDAVDAARDRYRLPRHVDAGNGDQCLRLDLDAAMDRALLHARAVSAGGTVLVREAPAPDDYGWCDGRAHEIVVAVTARGRARTTPPVTSAGPQAADVPRDVVFAHLAAPPEMHEEILTGHLAALVESWPAGSWWFTRARDRLRLRVHDADPSAVAGQIVAWSGHLRDQGLARAVTLEEYLPETGRYGTGTALAAAEALFAADSQVALVLLEQLHTNPGIHRRAMLAVSLADLAAALTGGRDAGMRWLIEHPGLAETSQAPERATRSQAFALASSTSDDRLAAAWHQRTAAARAYIGQLHARDVQLAPVIGSLLHMHHVRVAGIDPQESITHKLARAIALRHAATQEAAG